MDSPIQTEIEEYIAASRIRTARRRKRDACTQFEKQLIALHSKREVLNLAWYKRGYVPLEPPVMKGYKRFFVVRDDVARGKHADFYEQLLKKINTYDYSHRKDFKVKKRSHGRKKMVWREQHLLQPDESHFKRLAFTDREASCFEERFFFYKNSLEPVKRMVIKEPWRFVLRVRPNLITTTRAVASELRSEIHQLDNYIERHYLHHQIVKLTCSRHSGWRRWLPGDKKKYRFKHYTLQQLLQEEWYDKI
jgi:hypothetical protein